MVDDLCLPVRLWLEGRAQVKLDTGEVKKPRPEIAGEDRVPVADDGSGNAVKPDNVVEEGLCN